MNKKNAEGKLTQIEKDIVTHLQYYITNQKRVTLSELAAECHVAKSTVVKTAKKMGYSGFIEMSYQMQDTFQEAAAGDLANDLVEGDLEEKVLAMAQVLYDFRNCKNLVLTKGNHDICSKFLSRKLEMFDIFAPSTYEFHMVQNFRMKRGAAVFCDMRKSNAERSEELVKLVKHEGYYMIAFCDGSSDSWLRQYADMEIVIRKTVYRTADFYDAKVLIFIERMLSRLAELMKQEVREDPYAADEIYSQ